jgi:hypothetical protein
MNSDLDRLARRQHSLLACWQLVDAGWSTTTIGRHVDRGGLIPIRRGVFRTAGSIETQWQAWMAAVLASYFTGWLSHLSALAAYAFSEFPAPEKIDLVGVGAQTRMPGVAGHRTLWLPETDRSSKKFVPMTTAERAFVDSCGVLSERLLDKAGDDALRRKLITLPRLVRTFDHIPCSGRRKSAPMRLFLGKRVRSFDPGGSDRELDVRDILQRGGYALPKQQVRVKVEGHTYFIDYAWPETLHGIEWEGFDPHGKFWTPFHKDRERLRRLQRAGWTIYPVTSQTTANEILAIAEIATAGFRSVVPTRREELSESA